MTFDTPPTPAPDRRLKRRNRDAPARQQAAAQRGVPQPPGAVAQAGAADQGLMHTVEDVIRGGHRWLRFPAALEARFQAETLAPRRRLLIICGLLGILSIYLGTVNIAALSPDIVPLALRTAHQTLMACGVGLFVLLGTPPRWRRTWQAEGVTALIALGTCAGVIRGCMHSQADTTFTHSATLVTVVMYTCIAARQRFAWSLGCAALAFIGYVLLVQGHTPQQQLIVASNIKLMALSFAFALVANYTFEHRERRHWLLRTQEAQQRAALQDSAERLRRLSAQDPLTGLHNRRQFDTDLQAAWARASVHAQPVSLLMVDVDFFKRYNDTYGHPAGDACLTQVAQVLATVAQAHEGVAARLGGEEFALLLPGRTLPQAMDAAAALHAGLQAAGIEHRASGVAGHVTVSVGAAQVWPTEGSAPTALAKLADEALYQAKHAGRNRTCAASNPAGTPTPMPIIQGQDDPAQPSAPPAHAAPVAPEQAAVAAYTQTLQGQFRWLRFPADQEADYRHHDATPRRQHLTAAASLGLVVYNLYIFSNRAMFPDVEATALGALIGLSALLVVLISMIHGLKSLPPAWTQGLFSIGITSAAVCTIGILSQSRELTALHFSVCLALIPMFSGVGARQPFWFTCVPALITCLAAAGLLTPIGPQQALVYTDSVLMIVTNTVFTLILAYTLEHGARKEWLLNQIGRLQRGAMVTATQRLHELSILDPLTGLSNRRQFEDDLARLWAEGLRDSTPLALLIIDVDFFKRYNDAHGHPAGDRCLTQVAATLRDTAQAFGGLAARLGGEEFCILLPAAAVDQAVAVGERVCAAVRKAGIEHRHSDVAAHVTVSVGAASLQPAPAVPASQLLAEADDALYQAKLAGRDRVAAADPAHAQCAVSGAPYTTWRNTAQKCAPVPPSTNKCHTPCACRHTSLLA